MTLRLRFAVLVVASAASAALAGACSSSSVGATASPDGEAAPINGAPTEKPGDAGALGDTASACTTNVVPLVLTFRSDGLPDAQLVPVVFGGVAGYFAIDTGSGLTFVYGKTDATPKYDVTIGCETLRVLRRDFPPEAHEGKPILGVLGADFFLKVTTDFDYPGKRIVRHLTGAPAGVSAYPTVPLIDANGHIAVRAGVDTGSYVLMVDTGSPHVLLVPAAGLPGDRETKVQDVTGELIPAFIGESEISLGGEKRKAQTYRIPSWPYFEGYQKDIHPDLRGLFGLSGLGFRRIVVDKPAGVLRLGPIQTPPLAPGVGM